MNETILKICNAELSLEELEKISREDLVAICEGVPFEKRYSLSYILGAIEKCEKGEITDKYLRAWAYKYNGVIYSYEFENGSLQSYFVEEIRQRVDGLSFYEDGDDTFADFKKSFKVLDKVLLNVDNYDIVYNEDYDTNQGFTLIADEREREVAIIYTDPDLDYEFERVTRAALVARIRDLEAKGYARQLIGMNEEVLDEIMGG